MKLISYQHSTELDSTFAALADPTRRAILARLASGEASVAELAAPFEMTQPAISKHLRVLERAGLISQGRDAQRRPRRLEAKPLAQVSAWLERYREFWEERFQHLDALLVDLKKNEMQNNEIQSSRHSAAAKAAPLTAADGTAKAVPFPNQLVSDQLLPNQPLPNHPSTKSSSRRREKERGKKK
jgi:DNA-binding transcriptional ArsR family regulator